MFSITGIIKVKKETEQITDTFKKREFVLTDNSDQYPQDINFQLSQDKVGLIDNYKVGDTIEVSFNLRGREWINPQGEAKYFNTLDVWRVVGNQNNVAKPKPTPIAVISDEEEDLPF